MFAPRKVCRRRGLPTRRRRLALARHFTHEDWARGGGEGAFQRYLAMKPTAPDAAWSAMIGLKEICRCYARQARARRGALALSACRASVGENPGISDIAGPSSPRQRRRR